MIRIGKMTDYGIVLLTHFARSPQTRVEKARDLSTDTGLPLPTVSKILKSLCRGGLLVSIRGIKGGYRLAKTPAEISVADIIQVLEGPISLTECSSHAPGLCDLEMTCPVRGNWQIISSTVNRALQGLSLEQMSKPIRAASALTGEPNNRLTVDFARRQR